MTNETLPVNIENSDVEPFPNVFPSGIQHGFDTGYAIAFGVDEAIMIRNLQFFITANANRGNNLHEGRFWTYDKLEDFPKHFPYWSIKQIRRIITSLIEQEIIIKGDFNNKWSNRTAWYAFKDQDKFIKHTNPPKQSPQENTDLPKRANENCPNGQMSDAQMGNSNIDTSSISSSISSSSSLKVSSKSAANATMPTKVGDERNKKILPEDYSSEVMETGDSMIEALKQVKPDLKSPSLPQFLNSIDLMIRIDKREAVTILKVFRWAIADSFWADKFFKPNPAKYLREKFDQLEVKMNAKGVEFDPNAALKRRQQSKFALPEDFEPDTFRRERI